MSTPFSGDATRGSSAFQTPGPPDSMDTVYHDFGSSPFVTGGPVPVDPRLQNPFHATPVPPEHPFPPPRIVLDDYNTRVNRHGTGQIMISTFELPHWRRVELPTLVRDVVLVYDLDRLVDRRVDRLVRYDPAYTELLERGMHKELLVRLGIEKRFSASNLRLLAQKYEEAKRQARRKSSRRSGSA